MIDYSLRSIGFKTLKFETASRNSVCGHNLYMYSLQPTFLKFTLGFAWGQVIFKKKV